MADQTDSRREARTIQRQAAERFVGGRGDDERLPAIVPERIAYHPVVQERFGVDRAQWRALIDAIWPSATSTEGVMLALSYCKSRQLDPFKRPVHIVPIWSSALRRMVETVWPGIGELRTTAHRTGQYAGKARPEWGPRITSTFRNNDGQEMTLEHPEWCEITVYRERGSGLREFVGPRVYWLETYARESHNSEWPNSMWRKRVNGQLEKCSEAGALRAAFPEEVGEWLIDDEIDPGMRDVTPAATTAGAAPQRSAEAPPAGRAGWGRQYTDGGNGNGAAMQDEQPRQQEQGEREQARGGEERQQRAPEPEQTQQVADDDGGEARQQQRTRRTDEQRATDLIGAIEKATSAKELDQAMRGLSGRIAANPGYRKRIEDAEKARHARGFGSQPAGRAEPVITAFDAPMRNWQDAAALVDAKLKEAEATGVYGADGMDDETYTEVQRLLDAASEHLPDVVDRLNRRLDRFSDAGGPPPIETGSDPVEQAGEPEPEPELYELRDAVDTYGKKPPREYLEGLIAIVGRIPDDTPGRAQKIGAIRGRNVLPLSLLIERHRADEVMMQLVQRTKDALEFPAGG